MNVAFNLCGPAPGLTNKLWDHKKQDPVGQFVCNTAEEDLDFLHQWTLSHEVGSFKVPQS